MNRVEKWFANVYEGFAIIPMRMRKPSTRVCSGPCTTLPLCRPAHCLMGCEAERVESVANL